MSDKLEPSKKIDTLIYGLYTIQDKRLINDKFKEIHGEVIALEMQADELRLANESLIIENYGVAEMRETGAMLHSMLRQAKLFKGYGRGPLDYPTVEIALRGWKAALAAPNVEVPL